ncbi:MAG: SRPBCC family protein [Alphaproteobacteria bacterium]
MSVLDNLPKWHPMPGDNDWADRHGTKERYPEMDTDPIPVEPYVSPEFFEAEREKIFKKMWLYAGRMERLPNPGDYFVQKFEVLRAEPHSTVPSFIFMRGKDNKVRAFYNACQHRGTEVAWDETETWATSHRKFLSCRFHGWTYDNEGKLVHVPDEGQFFGGVDKSCRGLKEVPCAVWKDFIFMNLDPKPRQTLMEQLGSIADVLKDFPFENMRKVGIWTSTVRCNWKVALDAFQEGYHVSTVHAGTIPEAFNGALNQFCRPTSIRLYEQGNRGVTFMVSPDYAPPPAEIWARSRGSSWYAAGGDIKDEFPGANPEDDPYFAFSLNGVFPNMIVDPFIGGYYGHEFWPIDVNTTRWIGSINFLPPEKPSDIMVQEHGKVLLRDAFREDTVTLEASQSGIESGALDSVLMCDPESAPRHLVRACMEIVNS